MITTRISRLIPSLSLACLLAFGGLQAQENVLVQAFLTSDADNTQIKPVLIVASQEGGGAVKIARNPNDRTGEVQDLTNLSLTFVEPLEYAQGMEALGRAELTNAANSFQLCMSKYIRAQHIPMNYSTVALFRYGQCMIYQGNWESLRNNVVFKLKGELLPQGMREQAELFSAWLALGEENWVGLKAALGQVDSSSLRSAAKADFLYLQARLLEHEGEMEQAMEAYQSSLSLTRMSNPALTKLAADRLLPLYLADERVKEALQLDSEGLLRPGTPGSNLLNSAAAIHHLYSKILTKGEQPPAGTEVFAKYYSFQQGEAAEEEAEEEAEQQPPAE